ncbi:MAG: penicillin-binding protein, partial [Prevotella salivae]|nr:penicillin-binding protein [Segatella salivae]
DDTLIIQVGNGMRSADDSVDYVDPEVNSKTEDNGDVDEFEVVPETESNEPTKGHSQSE